MKFFTRHMIAMACVMMSAHALADGYKGEAPPQKPVTIPTIKGGVELGITTLFMTPSSSNLTYLFVDKTLLDASIGHEYNRTFEVSPNENWGFIFDLGFVFPNTSHDVRLNWMAFHSNYDNQHRVNGQDSVATNVYFLPAGTVPMLAATDFVKATAQMNYKLDTLDLTFGQYVNIWERLQVRAFSGLRYARVYNDFVTAYVTNWDTSTSVPSAGSFNGDIKSSFNGLGPILGAKAKVDLGKGLGLVGALDGTLLAGQIGMSSNQIARVVSDSSLTVYRNALNWETQKIIGTGFDAKFGLSYDYTCSNGTQLVGELGYQVSQYFDVIKQVKIEPPSTLLGTALIRNLSPEITNFDLSGPYFNLMVKI